MSASASYRTRSKNRTVSCTTARDKADAAKAYLAFIDSEADLEEQLTKLRVSALEKEAELKAKLKKLRARQEIALTSHSSVYKDSVASSLRRGASLHLTPTPPDALRRTREYVVSQASLRQSGGAVGPPAEQPNQPPLFNRPTRESEPPPKKEHRTPTPQPTYAEPMPLHGGEKDASANVIRIYGDNSAAPENPNSSTPSQNSSMKEGSTSNTATTTTTVSHGISAAGSSNWNEDLTVETPLGSSQQQQKFTKPGDSDDGTDIMEPDIKPTLQDDGAVGGDSAMDLEEKMSSETSTSPRDLIPQLEKSHSETETDVCDRKMFFKGLESTSTDPETEKLMKVKLLKSPKREIFDDNDFFPEAKMKAEPNNSDHASMDKVENTDQNDLPANQGSNISVNSQKNRDTCQNLIRPDLISPLKSANLNKLPQHVTDRQLDVNDSQESSSQGKQKINIKSDVTDYETDDTLLHEDEMDFCKSPKNTEVEELLLSPVFTPLPEDADKDVGSSKGVDTMSPASAVCESSSVPDKKPAMSFTPTQEDSLSLSSAKPNSTLIGKSKTEAALPSSTPSDFSAHSLSTSHETPDDSWMSKSLKNPKVTNKQENTSDTSYDAALNKTLKSDTTVTHYANLKPSSSTSATIHPARRDEAATPISTPMNSSAHMCEGTSSYPMEEADSDTRNRNSGERNSDSLEEIDYDEDDLPRNLHEYFDDNFKK